MAQNSLSYPEDPVLLSHVEKWISARAAMVPPFYLEGSAREILLDAIRQGDLIIFDVNRQTVTADYLKDSWDKLVTSRATVLHVWPEPQPPVPDFADYTLLWDAAKDMAKEDQRTPGWHWLRLMDAFWRGKISSEGLVYFFPQNPVGRTSLKYNREQIFAMLWGPNIEITPDRVAQLEGWSVTDYENQPVYGEYFKDDPEGRCGLAVLTLDLEDRHDRKSDKPPRNRKFDKTPRKREKGIWEWAKREALRWLEDEGAPTERGDQAKLEKYIEDRLGGRKVYPAKSTIRRHVKIWILDFEQSRRSITN